MTRDIHPRQQFEQNVEVGPKCWLWRAGKNNLGYGYTFMNGRREYAHRAAWELIHEEPIPEGLVIRHTCDNPSCVRPAHLLIGTKADNSRDMVERGRSTGKPVCKRGHVRPPGLHDCRRCVLERAAAQRRRVS